MYLHLGPFTALGRKISSFQDCSLKGIVAGTGEWLEEAALDS